LKCKGTARDEGQWNSQLFVEGVEVVEVVEVVEGVEEGDGCLGLSLVPCT